MAKDYLATGVKKQYVHMFASAACKVLSRRYYEYQPRHDNNIPSKVGQQIYKDKRERNFIP